MRSKWALLFATVLLGWSVSARAFIILPPPTVTVYEYHNDIVDRYLLLNDPTEIAFVDAGNAGPGWKRTGYGFSAYATQGGFSPSIYPVYRFYASGVNSHFYTAQEKERQVLLANWAWVFERIDFYTRVPGADGTCATSDFPIWRLYNNREQSGNPDHRYTGDAALRDSLVAQGWTNEGVNFCALGNFVPTTEVVKRRDIIYSFGFANQPGLCTDAAGCRDGAGMELQNVAPLTNSIGVYLNGPPYGPNPLYVDRFNIATGYATVEGSLYTSESPNDSNGVAGDSYVQDPGSNYFYETGIHVVAATRTGGTSAAINPTQSLPTSGGGHPKLVPFADGQPHTIFLTTALKLTTVRAWRGSAQGAMAIRFVDQVSGGAIDFSMQTFGTMAAAADSMTFDVASKIVKATTSFKATPSFSHTYSGSYVQCDPFAWGCGNPGFAYGIDQRQFGDLVTAARALNPALSADIRDYMVTSYRLENRADLDGEIGMTFRNFELLVYGLWFNAN